MLLLVACCLLSTGGQTRARVGEILAQCHPACPAGPNLTEVPHPLLRLGRDAGGGGLVPLGPRFPLQPSLNSWRKQPSVNPQGLCVY